MKADNIFELSDVELDCCNGGSWVSDAARALLEAAAEAVMQYATPTV